MRRLLLPALMLAMLPGCAMFGSEAKEEAAAAPAAKPEKQAEPKADAPSAGPSNAEPPIQMPGKVPEKLPDPGVDPMDKPGVDPLSDENLTYRVHLYWQARIKEKFEVAYALESEAMRERAPTLIKYIQRLGKSPKEYKEVRVTKVIRDKTGQKATVFANQHYKLVTPMLQRDFLGEEPEVWQLEDGAWRREFVDYAEVFRKQMGFELPEGYDPNSRQVTPPEERKTEGQPDGKDKDAPKK